MPYNKSSKANSAKKTKQTKQRNWSEILEANKKRHLHRENVKMEIRFWGLIAVIVAVIVAVGWGCYESIMSLFYDSEFVATEKADNCVAVENKKTGDMHVIEFAQAYRDSIIYNNIYVGDELKITLMSRLAPAVVKYNEYGNIESINGHKTKKMIKEFLAAKGVGAIKFDTKLKQQRNNQQVQQYMQQKHNVH